MNIDKERLDFLERMARKSRTGISLDWIPSVDSERSGFRFMRHHHVGEPCDDVRKAIDRAMINEKRGD